MLDKLLDFLREEYKKEVIPVGNNIHVFCTNNGLDYHGSIIDEYIDILIDKRVIRKEKSGYWPGIEFHTFQGFKSISNEKESRKKMQQEIDSINLRLGKFNYDNRNIPIYISIASVIIAFGFGVNSCVNEQSNKSETDRLKDEVKAIKDSISIYIHTKTGN